MLDMIQKSLPRVVRVNNKNNAMVYSSFILMRRNRWFCICREFEWVLQNYLHTHHSFQNVEFSFGSWSVRTCETSVQSNPAIQRSLTTALCKMMEQVWHWMADLEIQSAFARCDDKAGIVGLQ
jgi:hypothetical protein